MRKMLPLFTLVTFAVLLAACTTKIQHSEAPGAEIVRLEPGQKIYITPSKDGVYGENTYAGTGLLVAGYISDGVRPNAAEVKLAASPAPVADVLAAAAEYGARYAVVPEIIHWEPRIAGLSMRPTRVTVLVTVYDVPAGKQIKAHTIDVTGRIMYTVMQSPDKLAQTAIGQFCAGLF